MVLRMALLVAALSVRHVANGDMTFLERQQMLARQMWEDEMEISKQVAGAGAESATADEDEYDGYYDEDYYEAPEPLEEIVFVPKPAVKRKVRGYAISEETGLFQDILKPITYLDLLTAVASMIKCDSPTINGMNNAKRAQSVKEKTSAKSTATVAAEVPVDDQVDGKPRKLSFKEKQERKMKDRKAKELETAKPKEVCAVSTTL